MNGLLCMNQLNHLHGVDSLLPLLASLFFPESTRSSTLLPMSVLLLLWCTDPAEHISLLMTRLYGGAALHRGERDTAQSRSGRWTGSIEIIGER